MQALPSVATSTKLMVSIRIEVPHCPLFFVYCLLSYNASTLHPPRHPQLSVGHHRDIPPCAAHYPTPFAHRLVLLPWFQAHVQLADEPPEVRTIHKEFPGKAHHSPEGESLHTYSALGLAPLLCLHPSAYLAQMPDDSHRHRCDVAHSIL